MIHSIFFDLDGVLFDGCDFHANTFLEAYNTVLANKKISREYHDEILNGLSTRKKLSVLGVNSDDLERIYALKQELTANRIEQFIKEDMNYALGAHTNRPVAKSGAEIKHSEKVYSLYHYKNLGEKYYKYTHHRAKPRVADMEKLGISVHYTTNNNKLSRGEQKVIKTEHQVRPLSSFFIAK
jgi:hypothetical protein